MANVFRARWKPDLNRSALESLIQGFDPATNGGTIVLHAQIVMYDDARYNPAVAVQGKPDDEVELSIMWEEPLMFDLATLAAMTQPNVTAFLTKALDNWAQTIKPAGAGLVRIRRAMRNVGLRAIP